MNERKWFSPDNPFWVPKGTVRSILVLMFSFAVIFPIFKFVTYQEEIPQSVKEILLFLSGGLIPIIKMYFDQRNNEDEKDKQNKLNP